jgi:hypothetical protein
VAGTLSPWRRWGPLALVAAVCLLPFWGLWRAPGPPMEEGFMLVFPERVLAGDVPNRDFLHLYGPGSLWVLAGMFWTFGTSLEVQRLVAFAQMLGVAFGTFAVLRPWGRWLAAAGGSIAGLIILPPVGLSALAWVGAVALGLWALNAAFAGQVATGARRSRLLVGAGLLAGAAVLYRPDLVLALTLAGLVILWGLDGAARWRVVVGGAVGVAPYVVHIAMAGFGNAFHGMVTQPVFELRGGRRLPLPPSWDSFDGFLQRAGALAEPPWPLPAPPSPAQLSLWLGLLLAANVVLLVAGARAARRGDRRLLVLALFSIGLLPQAFQRADSAHLAWVSCVPLGLLPAAVADLLREWAPTWSSNRRRLAAVATPVVLMLALTPHFTFRSYGDYVAQSFGFRRVSHTIERHGRIFYYGRRDAADAVHELLRDVERVAEPGDTLLVGTGDLRKTPYSEAFLYYLLPELPPATHYIEMDPGVANAPDSGLAEEVAAADIVILSSIRDDWDEPNDSRKIGSDAPNRALARHFCQFGSYGDGLFGRGLYELYVRCEALE